MSYNNLSDPDVMEVLAKMQSLHVLNMIGNPLLRKTIDYRRNLLYKCKDITYLDSRPVTEKDRICLKAWAKVISIYVHIKHKILILLLSREVLMLKEKKEKDW